MCDATWLRATTLAAPLHTPSALPYGTQGAGVQALCFGAQNEFKLKSCEHFVAHKWGGGGVGVGDGGVEVGQKLRVDFTDLIVWQLAKGSANEREGE